MQSNVPMVNLGEVLTHRSEFITIDDMQLYKRVTAQLHAKGIILRDEIEGARIKTKKQRVCKAGDFLVAEIDAKLGGFGIVPTDLNGSIVSSHYFLFEIDSTKLVREYLDFFIRTEDFQKQITARGSTNYAAIRPADVLNFEIPLPSLEKQQRTVATLTVLIAKIEETRKERKRATVENEKVIRSYSNHFFDPNSHYPKFSLGDVAEIRSGVTLGRELRGKTIHLPYLRVANVQDGHLNLQKMKNVEILESEKDKWQLLSGDILLTEGGDWDKLGRGTVWRNEIPDCIHQNHIFRLRFNLAEFLPEYVSSFIGSDYSKSYFQSASKQTTNLASINQKQLKNLKIPKPSLAEQRKIVARIDRLRMTVDEVKRLQAETEREMVALVPAVLAKAFGGSM